MTGESKQQPAWHFASENDKAVEYNQLIPLSNQFVLFYFFVEISFQVGGNSEELGPGLDDQSQHP